MLVDGGRDTLNQHLQACKSGKRDCTKLEVIAAYCTMFGIKLSLKPRFCKFVLAALFSQLGSKPWFWKRMAAR